MLRLPVRRISFLCLTSVVKSEVASLKYVCAAAYETFVERDNLFLRINQNQTLIRLLS